MSGKSLEELGLKAETLPEGSLEELPEFGGFAPPPQPGPYRFVLPQNLSRAWEVFDYTVNGSSQQRVRLLLDKDAPLTIVQSPGNKVNGDTFQTKITNAERKRGKDGPVASDLDYLMKAFGYKQKAKSNQEYITEIKKQAGKEFGAEISYSFICSDQRNIRVKDAEGKLQEVENQKGCGSKYYQKDIAALRDAEGNYPTEIQCSHEGCGGILRAFANLENFRA